MPDSAEWPRRRVWPRTMVEGFARLRAADNFNFSIICNGQSWPVHKEVLVMHSSALAAHVKHPFKEAREARLDLSAESKPCVEALVQYFYSGDYSTPSSTEEPEVAFQTQITILADMYDIGDLKQLAIEKFHTAALRNPFVSTDSLARAADIAYDASGPTVHIRKTIVEIAARGQDMFTGKKEGSAFEMVMRKHPDLAVAVAKLLRQIYAEEQNGGSPEILAGAQIWDRVTATAPVATPVPAATRNAFAEQVRARVEQERARVEQERARGRGGGGFRGGFTTRGRVIGT